MRVNVGRAPGISRVCRDKKNEVKYHRGFERLKNFVPNLSYCIIFEPVHSKDSFIHSKERFTL